MALIAFTPNADGFFKATDMWKIELDAGRPVGVSFTILDPQFPDDSLGHTLVVCGSIAKKDLCHLCHRAIAISGLQLITAADPQNFWRSDHFGALLNRGAIPPCLCQSVARKPAKCVRQ